MGQDIDRLISFAAETVSRSIGPGDALKAAPRNLPTAAIAPGALALTARPTLSLSTDDAVPGARPSIPLPPRTPELPLPPRDRTAVLENAAIQRSAAGRSPAGDAPSGGSGGTQSDAPHEAGAEPEGQSSPANDVQLLAGEVWSLLKRRLVYEAERMGH